MVEGRGSRVEGCRVSSRLSTLDSRHNRHGFAVFFRVFEFAINRRHTAMQRGFELGQIADEDDQLRIRSESASRRL